MSIYDRCPGCGAWPRIVPGYGDGFAVVCNCPPAQTYVSDSTVPFYVVSDEEFDAMERALTKPVRPTESIVRGAEQIRRLYRRR